MLEIKAMIIPLLQNFHLEPIDYLKDIQIKVDMTIQPAHPIRMKFIPIQNVEASEMKADSIRS